MPVKIALVDDKAIMRNEVKDKLYSYRDIEIVLEASDGQEFLEKMETLKKEQLPDIVLIDLEMPGMDGIKTISIASTQFPEIKFIVLTIFDNNEKIFDAIKAGANGYLLKEDDAVNLIESILQVVNYNAVPMSPAIARKTLGLLKEGLTISKKKVNPGIISDRELEVLQALVEGLDYKETAEKLFLSPLTVRTHIANIYQKLHVKSKAQAIRMAYKNKWI